MCLEICELDLENFISTLGLAQQVAFIKTKVKLDLLNNVNMLIMVEKANREGICSSIYRYAKANNKHMKDYNKKKNF